MRVRRASEWAVKCALRDLRREDETEVEYFIFLILMFNPADCCRVNYLFSGQYLDQKLQSKPK